jgi:ribulose-5-phosphate 4-epimerase/fuculose-1-phosphate aldolase
MTPKEIVCLYCKEFHRRGWMQGSSGAMSLSSEITPNNKSILITSENVNKDSITIGDLFDLKLEFGAERILSPSKLTSNEVPIISNISPLFLTIYQSRPEIKCILDLTSEQFIQASKLAIKLWETKAEAFPNQLRITNLDILNRIEGAEKNDTIIIPVVESVNDVDAFKEILRRYPKTQAILIRNHGMMIFGKTAEKAKAHAEYFDLLCRLLLSAI